MAVLDKAIEEMIGNNWAMNRDFKAIVTETHKRLEREVLDRNNGLRQIFSTFGLTGISYCRLSGKVRGGSDVDKIPAFDEIVAFAKAHHPHLLYARSSESSTGSAEEGLIALIEVGIQPVPKVYEREVIEAALDEVGQEFFTHYESQSAEVNTKRVNIKVWKDYVARAAQAEGSERERMVKQIQRQLRTLTAQLQCIITAEVDLSIINA